VRAPRLLHEHPEAVLYPLGGLGLVAAGLVLPLGIAAFTALTLGAVAVVAWSFRRWPGDPAPGRLHARLALQTTAMGMLVYGTGWGAALALVFVVVIADNVRHAGAHAVRPAVDWSLIVVALGQLGVQLGWVPTVVGTSASHGIAVMGALVLTVAASRIRAFTLRYESAEAALAAAQQRAEHRATHDPLTGLANRLLFDDRLHRVLARARRHPEPFAVLLLDLDGFKAVNDDHGHAAGDAVLVAVAHRLRRGVRGADTAARIGGDEFAVIVEELSSEVDATAVAARLHTALLEPVTLPDGSTVRVGASVGVVVHVPEAGAAAPSAATVVARADAAMYRAKAAGTGIMLHAPAEEVSLSPDATTATGPTRAVSPATATPPDQQRR
jgi:diguanylate cyclase (GGDEF)-like protein